MWLHNFFSVLEIGFLPTTVNVSENSGEAFFCVTVIEESPLSNDLRATLSTEDGSAKGTLWDTGSKFSQNRC